MNIGVRTILVLAAVLLFVVAIFLEDRWGDLLALGLAAFAASFVADEFVGGRTLGNRT